MNLHHTSKDKTLRESLYPPARPDIVAAENRAERIEEVWRIVKVERKLKYERAYVDTDELDGQNSFCASNDGALSNAKRLLRRKRVFDVLLISSVALGCFIVTAFIAYSRYRDFSQETMADQALLNYKENFATVVSEQDYATAEAANAATAEAAISATEANAIDNASGTDVSTADASVDRFQSVNPIDLLNPPGKSAPVSKAAVAEKEDPRPELVELMRSEYANDEIIGYIRIDGTTIDYPVVQSTDNNKYLSVNARGKESGAGAIFLDYENDIERDDKNMIIYGHNMKTKTMFHELRDYRDKNFFDAHRTIKFCTLYDSYEYEAFSFYKAEDTFNYIQAVFDNDEEFLTLLNEMKSRSMHRVDTDVSADDRILTLSTCSNADDDTRYVINAKLVKKTAE
ncbi:MAG: class B sortase [Clostridiales bacterium]|jgi:sortase B|nr:class B sortase [Clostridiales bacterium]